MIGIPLHTRPDLLDKWGYMRVYILHGKNVILMKCI